MGKKCQKKKKKNYQLTWRNANNFLKNFEKGKTILWSYRYSKQQKAWKEASDRS